MFRLILCTIAILTAALGSTAATAQNRVALVIGQSAYRAAPALPNPANDAKLMAGLLTAASFDVTMASDLGQNELRQAISDFAARIATKGPNTVALVFYAGHGIQVDGENYLIPVDVKLGREADVPLQSVRLNDVMNTLASVPTLMRIVMLDACRNNPFPETSRTTGKGLALVDVRAGSAGTFISYSTSPGMEALDGKGDNSPYTSALAIAAREPNIPIEEAFKRVRVSVNKATDGQQTPWESSSLTDGFYFFPGSGSADAKGQQRPGGAVKSAEIWRKELAGAPIQIAYDIVIAADTIEAYEAFVALFSREPLGTRVRGMLERRREMMAWSVAVILNTVAGYQAFLSSYPNSDLAATARKLLDRVRNRPQLFASVGGPAGPASPPPAAAPSGPSGAAPGASNASPVSAPQNASLVPASGPTCSCSTPPATKKADKPTQKQSPSAPSKKTAKRQRMPTDEDIAREGRPAGGGGGGMDPAAAAAIGIGIGIGAGSLMRGRGGGGGGGGGGYGGHGH